MPNLRDGRVDEVLRRPSGFCAADAEDEVAQDLSSLPRVVHLGMELHRIPSLCRVLDSGHGVRRARRQFKARRQFQRLVTVRHPNRHALWQSTKKVGVGDHVDFGVPILTLVGRTHLAAERVHHKLQPVADAEHRKTKFEHASVGRRRIFVVDRPGRTGKHNADRGVAFDLIERDGARQDYGENTLFADAACDQLRILRAKIEDDDRWNE